MIFEIPEPHTYWDREVWQLRPSTEITLWLNDNGIEPIFTIKTDDSRGIMRSKYLTLDIKDLNKAMLFKLTWL